MKGINARGRKSRELLVTAEHLATLRSMLQKYPTAKVMHSPVGFGVLLAGNRYLDVMSSPKWTNEELIEWLDAFVVLLKADPDWLRKGGIERDGALFAEIVQKP